MEAAVERATRCGAQGNLWGVLGLRRDASAEEVRSALRAARLATHPDRNGGSDAAEAAATEAAKWVAKAAEVLGHPGKRRTYALAGYNLAAYEEEAAVALERETRKRQRAADAAAEAEAAAAAKRQRGKERQAAEQAAAETVKAAAETGGGWGRGAESGEGAMARASDGGRAAAAAQAEERQEAAEAGRGAYGAGGERLEPALSASEVCQRRQWDGCVRDMYVCVPVMSVVRIACVSMSGRAVNTSYARDCVDGDG
jgi:curved DNA-binding protein CbpA